MLTSIRLTFNDWLTVVRVQRLLDAWGVDSQSFINDEGRGLIVEVKPQQDLRMTFKTIDGAIEYLNRKAKKNETEIR